MKRYFTPLFDDFNISFEAPTITEAQLEKALPYYPKGAVLFAPDLVHKAMSPLAAAQKILDYPDKQFQAFMHVTARHSVDEIEQMIFDGLKIGAKGFLNLSGDLDPDDKNRWKGGGSLTMLSLMNKIQCGYTYQGDPLNQKSNFEILGVSNPQAGPNLTVRIKRLEKKVNAGANRIVTQAILDTDLLCRFLDQYYANPVLKNIPLHFGIPIIKNKTSLKIYERLFVLHPNTRIGVSPQSLNRLLEASNKEDEEKYALDLTVELIENIFKIVGKKNRFHWMSIGGTPYLFEKILPALGIEYGTRPVIPERKKIELTPLGDEKLFSTIPGIGQAMPRLYQKKNQAENGSFTIIISSDSDINFLKAEKTSDFIDAYHQLIESKVNRSVILVSASDFVQDDFQIFMVKSVNDFGKVSIINLNSNIKQTRQVKNLPVWQYLTDMIPVILEKKLKIAMFDCKECGNCTLSKTALICTETCAKGLTNGPCGDNIGANCGNVKQDPPRKCTFTKVIRNQEGFMSTLFPGIKRTQDKIISDKDDTLIGTSALRNAKEGKVNYPNLHNEGIIKLPATRFMEITKY